MTACLELEPLLVARSLGVLEPEELVRLEAHVPGCEQCRAFEKRVESELGSALPRVASPAGSWEQVARRIREAGASQSRVQVRVTLTCTFCHDPLARDETIYCAGCLAPHHEDCFSEHAQCAAPGCGETRTVRPQLLAPRRAPVPSPTVAPPAPAPVRLAQPSSLAPIAVVVAVLAGLGGVAAFGLTPMSRPHAPLPAPTVWPSPDPTPSPSPTPPPPAPGAKLVEVLVAARALLPWDVLTRADLRRLALPDAVVRVNPDRFATEDQLEGLRATAAIDSGQILTRALFRVGARGEDRLTITKVVFPENDSTQLHVEGETRLPDRFRIDVSYGFAESTTGPIEAVAVETRGGKWAATFHCPRKLMAGQYVVLASFALEKQSAADLVRAGWTAGLSEEERVAWRALETKAHRRVGTEETERDQEDELRRSCREFQRKTTDCFDSLERAYMSARKISFVTDSELDETEWRDWVMKRAPGMSREERESLAQDARFVDRDVNFVPAKWQRFLEAYWLPMLEDAMLARTTIEGGFLSFKEPKVAHDLDLIVAVLRTLCQTDTNDLYAKSRHVVPSELREVLTYPKELELPKTSRAEFEAIRVELQAWLDAPRPKRPR